MLAQDGLSDKPKEDRVVKFKDEQPEEEDGEEVGNGNKDASSSSSSGGGGRGGEREREDGGGGKGGKSAGPERGRSRTRFGRGLLNVGGGGDGGGKKKVNTVSILKDPSRTREQKKSAAVAGGADKSKTSAKPSVKLEDESSPDMGQSQRGPSDGGGKSTKSPSPAAQEESGYDSDQTPRSSAASSDPESPESSRSSVEKEAASSPSSNKEKAKQKDAAEESSIEDEDLKLPTENCAEELIEEKREEGEEEDQKDLSLESIMTRNGAIFGQDLLSGLSKKDSFRSPGFRVERDFRDSSSSFFKDSGPKSIPFEFGVASSSSSPLALKPSSMLGFSRAGGRDRGLAISLPPVPRSQPQQQQQEQQQQQQQQQQHQRTKVTTSQAASASQQNVDKNSSAVTKGKRSVREMVKQLEAAANNLNRTDEEKLLGSSNSNISASQDSSNITKVEVAWEKAKEEMGNRHHRQSDGSRDVDDSSDELDAILGEEASTKTSSASDAASAATVPASDCASVASGVSAASSASTAVPMDFGESLPPTLTALADGNKQFRLCRLRKAGGQELGVLITKKVARGSGDRDRASKTAGYVVAYVEPGGLVDRDGRLHVGDEIVNVNGQV